LEVSTKYNYRLYNKLIIVNFPNNLYTSKDYGTFENAYHEPDFDNTLGVGRRFKGGSVISFVNAKSTFGDKFMMSFWMKIVGMDALNSQSLTLFTRKSST
jgi:hypothetical protein